MAHGWPLEPAQDRTLPHSVSRPSRLHSMSLSRQFNELPKSIRWTVGVAAGAIIADVAAGAFRSSLPLVAQAAVFIWDIAWTPISLPVVALIGSMLIIPGATRVLRALQPNERPQTSPRNYTRDEVFGINWMWKWSGPNKTTLDEHDLLALCPHCSMEFQLESGQLGGSPRDFADYLDCKGCNTRHQIPCCRMELRNRVCKELIRRVRTGLYKDRLDKLPNLPS